MKRVSKHVNTKVYGGISQKVLQGRDLHKLKENLWIHMVKLNTRREKKRLHESGHLLLNAEENFLKQKSRNNWLNLGDYNSGLFL